MNSMLILLTLHSYICVFGVIGCVILILHEQIHITFTKLIVTTIIMFFLIKMAAAPTITSGEILSSALISLYVWTDIKWSNIVQLKNITPATLFSRALGFERNDYDEENYRHSQTK